MQNRHSCEIAWKESAGSFHKKMGAVGRLSHLRVMRRDQLFSYKAHWAKKKEL